MSKAAVQSDGRHFYAGLSTDTKPRASRVPLGSTFVEIDTGNVFMNTASAWFVILQRVQEFVPSGHTNGNYTMDGSAKFEALDPATTKVRIWNKGATTEDLRVSFGEDETEAGDNLTIASSAATTGILIPPNADSPGNSIVIFGVPAAYRGGVLGLCNAVNGDTQVANVLQGT